MAGIYTIDDIRARCRVDEETGCWNWACACSNSRGNKEPRLWLPQEERTVTLPYAAWVLSGRPPLLDGQVVWRKCRSSVCGNPKHMMAATRKERGELVARSGTLRGNVARRLKSVLAVRSRSPITAELARWAIESPQNGREVAHALGVTETTVSAIRRRKRWRPVAAAASIFAVGEAWNASMMREAA